MAYALITSAYIADRSANGNAITTTGITTSGGDLLICTVSAQGPAGQACSDNQSNTFTATNTYGNSGNGLEEVWYKQGGTHNSGHTFTGGVAVASYPSIAAAAFSGSAASPLDQQAGTIENLTISFQAGSITPSEDNCLVIAAIQFENTSPPSSIDGGFTILATAAGINGQSYGCSLAYLIQTTAAAANPTWTMPGAVRVSGTNVSFKAASGGGGGSAVRAAWQYYVQRGLH